MEAKELIIEFLTKAGFKEAGRDQYHREDIGVIFIRQYDVQKVMFQIMELGRKHQAKDIRDALMIKAELFHTVVFQPQV